MAQQAMLQCAAGYATSAAGFATRAAGYATSIGAKRGGTREQCSQKLLELAEIFRKIIKVFKIY